MIYPRISAVWSTTKPIAPFSCTPCVQEVHTKAEVVHLTPGVYGLSFGMYFLYTWCTREWCNLFGRTPNCRDSRINHSYISQYISYAWQLNDTPKPRRPGVRCTTSAVVVLLVHVVYKRMLQSAWCTPIYRDSMVNHMFRNTFHMRDYCIIHLSLGDQG